MSMYTLARDVPPADGVRTFSMEKGGAQAKPGAISALARFIPTEILAPYAAALSIAPGAGWNVTTVYYAFIAATPVCFVLFAFAKKAAEDEEWPAWLPLTWRAVAATTAFAVWGLAVPNNPFQDLVGGPGVAGFLAMAISPLLVACDRIAMKVLGFDDV